MAALAVRGVSSSADAIKLLVGRTDRGLSIRQMRDAFARCGFKAEAMFYDKSRIEAVPTPSFLICDQGHWIFALSRSGNKFEIFDPDFGWSWQPFPRLRRRVNRLGVAIERFWETPIVVDIADDRSAVRSLTRGLWASFRGRVLWTAISIFVFSQIFLLLTPLVAMKSADEAFGGLTGTIVGQAALAFGLLSLVNVLMTLGGDLLYNKVRRVAENSSGRMVTKALECKPFEWFERTPAASLQNKIGSLSVVVDFYVSLIRSLSTAMMSLLAGITVLWFVSPALLLPGLLTLFLSVAVDLLLQKRSLNFISSHVGANQRYQRFVLETLPQFPLFVRHEATQSIKRRHRAFTRQKGAMHSRLQTLESWRTGLNALIKSGENLFFVVIAASFMGAGAFAIGGFVALGAYKDLLSGSLGSLFRLWIERRSLSIHEMQAASLFDDANCVPRNPKPLTEGRIEFFDVCFRYGSFDELVLENVTFDIKPGQLTVLRGPSGLGKSTIAKLMLGHLTPESGSVNIDGINAASGVKGIASIFQSDPLIYGSLRENLTLFDRSFNDDEIWPALKIARLDQFVMSLPLKLDTQVSEGLGGLSGGQKQRLLLARALVLRPKVLVLDEATAALDPRTEREIFEGLLKMDCTIFAIAHRPEVLQFADRVLEITEARFVVEVPQAEFETQQLVEKRKART